MEHLKELHNGEDEEYQHSKLSRQVEESVINDLEQNEFSKEDIDIRKDIDNQLHAVWLLI